jgi:hypothetical protein
MSANRITFIWIQEASMKMIRLLVLPMVVAIPWLMSFDIRAADVSVGVEVSSVSDFDNSLSAHGTWVEVGSYGRCWHPYGVEASWRPYSDGTWVWTDQGWYWQSDEPWAWACYHYGRWWNDPYYGWVWVPDTMWGPSWVCFREGGGYCGWAPLPPGAVFGARGEIVIGVGFVPDNWFMFVGERRFGERHHARDFIVNNRAILSRTTINTRIRRENNRVVNEGPRMENLQRVNHERIQTANIQALRQREKVPPAVLRKTPQPPLIQRENQRPPEIIRGTPNSPPPAPPSAERQQRVQPPPEQKERIEQRPSGPPSGERIAPPAQQQRPPPPEQRSPPPPQGEHGEGRGQGGEGGQEGRGH